MKKMLLLTGLFLGSVSLLSAQHSVKGTVRDRANEPMVSVNIFEKGGVNGTISDLDGAYEIQVSSPDAVLVFSFAGIRLEVPVNGQTTLDVKIEENIQLREVQIVGTRSPRRTSVDTPVPIDIILISEVANDVGQVDINQLLQYAAPSFNANKQSGSDGADHIDPATLRGLGPDQTLVLINGKRRHQSSLINIFGTRGRGNTGTDLNTIPAAAIERIEILRDGASAQYGSDAIAGVINIVLKSSVEAFTGNVTVGAFNADPGADFDVAAAEAYDGKTLNLNTNYGVRIGQGGFANITMDYLTKTHTNRPADPAVFDIYRQQFGDAAADNFSTWLNMGIPLSDKSSFYAFGGISHRFTDAFAWTRSADSDRNIPEIYPNGFDPHITSNIDDRSLSAGLRSKLGQWDLDLNNTYGKNRFHYLIDGTLNASLLTRSPTKFDAGGFQLSQNTTGAGLSRYFKNALSGINLAFGTEYRVENYGIFAGEEGSWRNYGIVQVVDSTGAITTQDVLGRAGGSQGFPGFQPSNELDEFRTNLGAYADAEFDLTHFLMVGAAARYESYSDFGNTLNGKLTARLEITKNLALRASGSTGFRAPSLAQIYFNSTFTDFVGGTPVDKIIARNDSPIARALGIPALQEEKATNACVGLTASFGSFTATLDGYYVDIRDRIVLTGAFEDTDPDIGDELQALNVGAAQFFTNAIDTRTLGLDLVLGWSHMIGGGRFRATFAANFNQMELGDITTNDKLKGKEDIYFGTREQKFLLASAPDSKMNLTLDYRLKKFHANVRLVRFGEVVLEDWLGTDDVYEAAIVADLLLGYNLTKNLSLSVGAANILNAYPIQQDTETETGGLWDAVQMGTNGAFYFAKLGVMF